MADDNVIRPDFGGPFSAIRQTIENPSAKAYGGGSGGGDMLEARFGRLEADVSELRIDVRSIKVDLSEIRVTLARIEAELRHKVDYKWLTVYVLGIAALLLKDEILRLLQP